MSEDRHWPPLMYGLDGQPIDWAEASRLLADAAARRVGLDSGPGWAVSTAFLVMDHGAALGMGQGRQPVLWETLVSGPDDAEVVRRYTSRAEAEAGHAQEVARLRGQ